MKKNISYLQGTNAWLGSDTLPLFRHTNNAFIYLSYILSVGSVTGNQKNAINHLLEEHLTKDSIRVVGSEKEPSHDEVMGYMIISKLIGSDHAYRLWLRLQQNGFRIGSKTREDYEFRGIDRFIWFRAFSSSIVDHNPALVDQVLYFVWMLAGAFNKDKGTTPYLKRWVTMQFMHKYAIPALGIAVFKLAMKYRGRILPVDLAINTGVKEVASFSEGFNYLSSLDI